MIEWWQQLAGQFAAQSGLELVAVALALAYVWLAARQNIWCWPCALVSTGIYVWVFWEVSLPFHTFLNAYYLAMAVYGWTQWRKTDNDALVVNSKPALWHIGWILFLAVTGYVMVWLVGTQLDQKYPYLDGYIAIFSVFTTVLVARKVLENWLYWMVINSFASYLFFVNSLEPTSLLHMFYVGFSIYGYISWQRSHRAVLQAG